jgi:HK97 gp10 family phage protein
MLEIKIDGLDKLQDALLKLEPAKAKAALRAALKAGADPIKQDMAQSAPYESGILEENIGTKLSTAGSSELRGAAFIGPTGKGKYPAQGAGGGLRKKKRSAMPVATIARFLEFGTSKMAARPFMTQAFERQKGNALERIIAVIKEKLGL